MVPIILQAYNEGPRESVDDKSLREMVAIESIEWARVLGSWTYKRKC